MGLVAVNGSPSDTSKTHAVATAAVELAGGGSVINVGDLDADALVLRGRHASVSDALEQVAAAQPLVLVTPVYRATYSGLLKLILDQLPTEAFDGKAVILAATGASPAHFLSIDTGFRSLVASLGGWSVPTVIYANQQRTSRRTVRPFLPCSIRCDRALDEAALIVLSGAVRRYPLGMAEPGGSGPIGPYPPGVETDEQRDEYDRLRRRVLWKMPYGLYVLGSTDKGERRNGMTVNWVTQVSFDPKWIGVGVEQTAFTHELIEAGGCFSLNVDRPRGPRDRAEVHQAGRRGPRGEDAQRVPVRREGDGRADPRAGRRVHRL